MKKAVQFIIGATIIAGAIGAIYYFGLSSYLTLESVKTNASYLKEQAALHSFGAVFIFLATSIVLITCTLPVTGPIAVIAGFLFSFWAGVLYTMIATMVGTALSFLLVRSILNQVAHRYYGDQLTAFKEKIRSYGYSYLVTLQLLTVVPYFIINTLAALAGVPFYVFMWTTFLGSLPVVMIYTFAGRQLYMIQSWQDILSFNMLALLLMLAFLAMLPTIIRRFKKVD